MDLKKIEAIVKRDKTLQEHAEKEKEIIKVVGDSLPVLEKALANTQAVLDLIQKRRGLVSKLPNILEIEQLQEEAFAEINKDKEK